MQFGLRYGIANRTGQVSRDAAAMILHHALSMGLDTLDTAIAYGQSEQRLGDIGVEQWRVISKLPAMPEGRTHPAAWVQESVLGSLRRLKIPRLGGLLLHRSEELLAPHGPALFEELQRLKEEGKVERIGVSIYSPDELDALWPHYQLDLVQAPFNILDRRLATSGWLTRLHDAGIEVHIRSVFLQGLLLMEAAKRPAPVRGSQEVWDRLDHWLTGQRVTALQAALSFAFSRPEIDRIIVGVDSLTQLQEVLAAGDVGLADFPESLASGELGLINPSKWTES